MAKKIYLKQVSSDINWEVPRSESWRYIKESMLLRITEAIELMAQNHKDLVRDRDDFERWYREEHEKVSGLKMQIIGLKGYVTRLKKKVK